LTVELILVWGKRQDGWTEVGLMGAEVFSAAGDGLVSILACEGAVWLVIGRRGDWGGVVKTLYGMGRGLVSSRRPSEVRLIGFWNRIVLGR
jgi:hypothetical protein